MFIPPINFGYVEEGLYRSGQPSSLNFPFLAKLKLKKIIYLAPDSPSQEFFNFVQDSEIEFIHLGSPNFKSSQFYNSSLLDGGLSTTTTTTPSFSAAPTTQISTPPPLFQASDFISGSNLSSSSSSVHNQYQYQFYQQMNSIEQNMTRFNTLGLISEELVLAALEIILNPANYPLAVMCNLGRHRTGTVIGCLRKLQGWNLTSILEEYRRYAASKVRLQNEQFIELFDTDLVRLPEYTPSFLN